MSAFIIEFIDNCIIIKSFEPGTGIPMDALKLIPKLSPKNAIMDPDMARIHRASIAGGTQDALKKLRKNPITLRRQQEYRGALPSDFSEQVKDWLTYGNTGSSSYAILFHLLNASIKDPSERDHLETPRDVADFERCLLLIEAVPELGPRIHEMSSVSPAWARFVEKWDELKTSLNLENPAWRTDYAPRPLTNELLNQVRE